jgi:hypothetical protein
LKPNAPDSTVAVLYLFIVPPGNVASPFFSAAPAALAPWALASFDDGMEPPLFCSAPPAVPWFCVVGALLVGPLLDPALPWLDWANAWPRVTRNSSERLS